MTRNFKTMLLAVAVAMSSLTRSDQSQRQLHWLAKIAAHLFFRPATGALLGMLLTIGVQAAPVSFTPYFFRSNIMNPPGSDPSTEDVLAIGVDSVNPMQNTSAIATQGATNIVLSNFGANELGERLPYNPAQLGSWTITVTNGTNGTHTATSVTHDLVGVQPLPVVSNINLSGSLTPTLTWELPATSVPFTRIRVRISNLVGGATVFNSGSLPTNATAYTLPSGVWQLDRDYLVRVLLEEVRSSDLFNRSDTRVIYKTDRQVLNDYNGDGKADLIWRNQSTGQVYGMLLNGATITQQGMIYTEPNTAWQIVQNGDLTGDGKADLLWWNSATGQVYLIPMDGLIVADGAMIHQEPNTAWQIGAVGDLDGDPDGNGPDKGKTDLIWWNNQTGEVYGMLMNGSTISSQGPIYQELDTAWRIVTARDFTGDGKADLLWRHNSTGHVYLMPMNGLTIANGGAMVHHEPDLAWQIAATGDLNGDGKADLIWRNSTTGQVYGMLMDGATITQQNMVYAESNLAWQIVASGDYTGDGKADLLWRNGATGQLYEMPMSGLAVTGGAVIYQEADANWRIVANTHAPRLPAKAFAGAHHTSLGGEPLNPHWPFDGEPVNLYQPKDGEPLNPAQPLPADSRD